MTFYTFHSMTYTPHHHFYFHQYFSRFSLLSLLFLTVVRSSLLLFEGTKSSDESSRKYQSHIQCKYCQGNGVLFPSVWGSCPSPRFLSLSITGTNGTQRAWYQGVKEVFLERHQHTESRKETKVCRTVLPNVTLDLMWLVFLPWGFERRRRRSARMPVLIR